MCTCHHTRFGETKQNASTSLGSALRVKNVSWRTECQLVRWMLEEIFAQGECVNLPEDCIGSDSWSVSGAWEEWVVATTGVRLGSQKLSLKGQVCQQRCNFF